MCERWTILKTMWRIHLLALFRRITEHTRIFLFLETMWWERKDACYAAIQAICWMSLYVRQLVFFFEEKRERGIGSKSPRWRGELEKLLALHAHKQPKESLEQLNFSFTSKFYLSASSFQVSELFCYALFSCSILYLFCCVPFSKLFTFYIAICCIFLSLFFIISVKKATINSSTRISAHNTLSFFHSFTFANDVCFCLFESFAFFSLQLVWHMQ